ncbi:hypothetical protein [Accumulibacter sp.]|uniref:hypothetical protein n=1 Tax=Accumulibacter sp. TaxID=2053492 RepID=UPI0025FE42E6|nr:hypothetical protein [Accumulibacter sp.]MCM8595588.1 hypothetical protein [Accumulibacter sp.]MCM8624854.1 hypothetical protein [Accumulibacter sp.]MDS4049736.1 hypothetical protein [Accumulibacter sp.]
MSRLLSIEFERILINLAKAGTISRLFAAQPEPAGIGVVADRQEIRAARVDVERRGQIEVVPENRMVCVIEETGR